MTFIWGQTTALILFWGFFCNVFYSFKTLAVPDFGSLDKHVKQDLKYVTLQFSIAVILNNLSLWIPFWFPIEHEAEIIYSRCAYAGIYFLLGYIRFRNRVAAKMEQNANVHDSEAIIQQRCCFDSWPFTLRKEWSSAFEAEGALAPLRTALQRSPQVSTGRLAKSNIQERLPLLIWPEQRQPFLAWPRRDEASTVNCPSWNTTCVAFPVTKTSESENYAGQFISGAKISLEIWLSVSEMPVSAQKQVQF